MVFALGIFLLQIAAVSHPSCIPVVQVAVRTTCVQGAPSCSKPPARASLLGLSLLRSPATSRATARSGREQQPLRRVECAGLGDFVGGDLLGFDLDDWVADVEKYGSIAVYAPPEGGYEGRYVTRLKAEGYHFMNISARGLGDPEAYLTKVHGVRPVRPSPVSFKPSQLVWLPLFFSLFFL